MLENPGSIPVDWCFLFPEDQQLELECWAESVEFSPAELQQMKVQEHRLFSVSPRSGTLHPGQQRAVQLTHRHDFAGSDLLPVLLKLSHGREILLNFLGVTVERDRPYVHFPSSRHTFTPVPVGGFSPPKQVYELYNGGAVPVRFHIDTAPLERLTEENFGHPVLQCLTPRGEVQPGRTASLEWIFSPLEAKTYTVDVPVHVLEGDSALVRFEGRGWDGRSAGEVPPARLQGCPPSVPSTQRVALPGQLVFLSEERVSLGDIPVCSRSTRILFLTNVSLTERVLYTWNLPQDRSQQVQVVPDSGLLDAGQSALCILTLQASGTPSFYLLDLICQVTTERAMAQHEDELQRWEKERERQGNEFTFTEQGIEPPAHALLEKDAPECVTSAHSAGTTIRKYKTLPPICSSDGDLFGVTGARPSREERRARRRAARVWRRPELPRPFLLHLGVTARSHSHLEFQSCFPSRLNTHYKQRTLKPKLPCLTHSGDRSLFSHGTEREIITHTVSCILRGLLDDPQVQQSLVDSSADPVPYFSQIRSRPQRFSSAERSSLDHSPESQPCQDTLHESQPCQDTLHESQPCQDILHESQLCQDTLHESQHCQDILLESQLHQNTLLESLLQEDTLHESQLHEDAMSESQLSNDSLRESDEEQGLQEAIRRLPEFSDLVEDVLLNTLQNLMTEAFLGEVLLTARPRTIALPPSSARKSPKCGSRKPSVGTAGIEKTTDPIFPLQTSLEEQQGSYLIR